jgi:hypothetical protein
MAGDPAQRSYYVWVKGQAFTVSGKSAEAIAAFKDSASDAFGVATPGYLAINYVRLNRLEEARAAIKDLLKMDPTFNLRKWRESITYRDPEILNRELADLAKAGLPNETS